MEVCVDTLASATNAVKGGARRLELCSSLSVGGLTPTIGFMKVIRDIVPNDCKLFVMIRPRPFDFHYSDDELRVMMEDIKIFKAHGVDGFVFGCLNSSREINEAQCKKLLSEAHPLPCTFHRAFDLVPNPVLALSVLDNLGFSRILTSGQRETAFLGRDAIKALVIHCQSAKLEILVMPGGGIDNSNLEAILEHTGVQEFHGSAKSAEAGLYLTSEDTVKKMIQIGDKFGCHYK